MNHLVGLFPRTVAKRHYPSPENPRYSLGDPLIWDALTGGNETRTSSGQTVNTQTALGITSVLACVRVLAEAVASIPLIVYERKENGGKQRAIGHQMYSLLHDRPNGEHPSFVWRETLMAHLALRGNAFVEKEYDNRGRIIGLWPIRPDIVTVERKNGVKRFVIRPDNQGDIILGPDQVMHIPGLGYDGLVGYAPIALAREALGLALAGQEHAARYFENGAEPGGVVQHPARLSPAAAANLKASFEAKHRGSANAHRVAVLEEGMTWQSVGISNRDLQFIENRKFQISEIARIYRVPPHMIGDLERATFSNIEQQSIDFVVHTIRPWLVRWEQVLNWELFSERDRGRFFCEFSVEGLLRGDSAARGAFYNQLFQIGALSVNDIREKENMNPVEGGDKRFVPLNMQLLEQAGTQPPPIDPSADPKEPAGDEVEESEDAERSITALQPMVRDVLDRALQRESTAAKRAAKRGLSGFRTWLTAYDAEQSEYMTRALSPVFASASALLGSGMVDEATIRQIALREVAKHVAAYRMLEEPTEDVVSDMLARAPDESRDLTIDIIGAVRAHSERKAA